MTLNSLVGKTLEKITVNPDAVKRLISAAERNIADSKVTHVSAENRFDAAYKAIMQIANAALQTNGYRTLTSKPGHHQTMIQSLSKSLGIDSNTLILLDAMRKQRNIADYSGDIVPESTVKDCITQAEILLKQFKRLTAFFSQSDSDPYQPESAPLFEAIYGKNLISLGGIAAIDNMFSDLSLNGLKALDIGFGLGGVAFHLAEQYKMKVAGVEIHPWMVEYARDHSPASLSDSLEFHTYNSNGDIPYHPQTFDLVYSKGVLNHVTDKSSLCKQINTVLKLNGLFVIADWIFPKPTTDSSSPLVCETKESYEQALVNTGFSEIHFRDDSKLFLNYAKELLARLSHNQTFIKQKYGEELFLIIQKQHEELIEKIQQHQKIAVRIIAKKKK